MAKKASFLRRCYHRLAMPPGRWHFLFSLLWLGGAALFSSNAAIEFSRLYVILYCALFFTLVWISRLCFYMVEQYRIGNPSKGMGSFFRWFHWPLTVGLWIAISYSGLTFHLRVRQSEPALLSFVHGIRPGTSERFNLAAKNVGWFWVSEVEEVGGCIRIITCHHILYDAGIAFSPGLEPPQVGADEYSPIYGSWWKWKRKW